MIYVKAVFCVIVLAAVVFRFVFQVKKEDRVNESYALFLAVAMAFVMLPHYFIKPGMLLETCDYVGLFLALVGIFICFRTRYIRKKNKAKKKEKSTDLK